MSGFRYLIDEDTPHAIRDGLVLRQPEIEVRVVGGELAPPLSVKDPEILDWIELHGFILITCNRSTMPQHLKAHLEKGGHVPGIFVLRHSVSFGQIIDDLLLIWEAGSLEEYSDRIEYIPL
jgi:hypothetical protein